MLHRIMSLAVAAALTLAGAAGADQTLKVGDAAPKFDAKAFVKGKEVKDFEKGKVYVVEFWATWCPPCRTSIPHLTKLQKQYKDVTFVGISNETEDEVKPFVEKMGDKMDYAVALDGGMWGSWLQAAGQDGIPAAFIVNGEGKVAWVGHPTEMDKPLAQIVAGKYDVAKEAAKAQKAAEIKKALAAHMQKLAAASKRRDADEMHRLLDEALEKFEEQRGQFVQLKLRILKGSKAAADKVAGFVDDLLNKYKVDDAEVLNFVAWTIVDPAGPIHKGNKKVEAAALAAAEAADKAAKQKNGSIADTLATAQFVNGKKAEAVETQKRAIKLSKASDNERERAGVKELEDRLAAFEKGELTAPKKNGDDDE